MKKIYILPNLVTTANMFFGFDSIVCSIHQDYVGASWMIVAAGICDLLDGRIARLAKATSHFGVEYDSLSDLLSFGVAPAVLMYLWAFEPYNRLGWVVAFLFVATGALRLARFNVSTNQHTNLEPEPIDGFTKNYFQGMPITMAAQVVATLMIFSNTIGWEIHNLHLLLFISVGLSILMISNVKFPSFKELNWKSKGTAKYLFIGLFVMGLVAVRPEVTLFLLLACYVGIALGWNVVHQVRRLSAGT